MQHIVNPFLHMFRNLCLPNEVNNAVNLVLSCRNETHCYDSVLHNYSAEYSESKQFYSYILKWIEYIKTLTIIPTSIFGTYSGLKQATITLKTFCISTKTFIRIDIRPSFYLCFSVFFFLARL